MSCVVLTSYLVSQNATFTTKASMVTSERDVPGLDSSFTAEEGKSHKMAANKKISNLLKINTKIKL